ncbi:MAG: acetylornithine transaminase [Myxococcota bacterium]|nr:acetylornithine transaminase [Myxococcota bacterium]
MTDVSQEQLAHRASAVLTPNYRPAPIVFERGEGVWLYDRNGHRYLDFAAGIAVCGLGHNHPRLTQTIREQAGHLLHVSNLYLNRPSIELAERLTQISFGDRVYFANSGAEANEAALKLARRYAQAVQGNTRSSFICANLSFHGRTWAAISATGQPKYHQGFGPLVPGFVHVPYNDLPAIASAIDETTCAIMLEPIQGEGGIRVPDDGYLEGVRALCDEHGLLMILDEVQTGVGRTGHWFAYQHSSVEPDIMSLAKGLGGGVPIGAMVCKEHVAEGFQPGVHASTYGGNPLVCAAALSVIDTIHDDGLLTNAIDVGAYLSTRLADVFGSVPGFKEVRGRGLMVGVSFDAQMFDRAACVARARHHGLLLTTAGPDALRFVPPLILGRAHVDHAIEFIERALASENGDG